MKTLAVLALTLPFGPAEKARPEPWTETTVAGITLLLGPADTKVGLSGLTMTMPVRAAGGEGQAVIRQGITRDVAVSIRDADVRTVAGMFDLPGFLRPKLVGKVGRVDLTVKGDRFELKMTDFRIPHDPVSRVEAVGDLKAKTVTAKVYAFGGLVEYSGRIPGE